MGPGTGRLAGRRILITGAASGVGKATAERFVCEGAKVALVDINAAALAEVSAALSAPHFAADVADEADVRAAVAGAAEALGGLDGVANVAGMAISRPLASTTIEEWNRTLAVNLTAAFLVSREALPHLEACEGATIVNVSSASGLMPLAKGLGPYAASKAGLITLSKALAFELAPRSGSTWCAPGRSTRPCCSTRSGSSHAIPNARPMRCGAPPIRPRSPTRSSISPAGSRPTSPARHSPSTAAARFTEASGGPYRENQARPASASVLWLCWREITASVSPSSLRTAWRAASGWRRRMQRSTSSWRSCA